MALDNAAIAQQLEAFASLLDLSDASFYTVRAYRRAAELVRTTQAPIEALVRAGRVRELSGIGPGIEARLRELVETGEIAELRELEQEVTPELVGRLAAKDPAGAPAVVASCRGAIQPLLGCYQPSALELLGPAFDRPLRELVAAIEPRSLEVHDPDALFNINTPDDLLRAAATLDRRRAHHRRPIEL